MTTVCEMSRGMKREFAVHSLRSGFAAVAFLALLLVSALAAFAPAANAQIYWSDLASGNIGRANLNGAKVNKRFIEGPVTPAGLTVAGRHIYWADSNRDTIGRARLDGSGVNESLVQVPDPFTPYDVAVNGRYIYWPNASTFIGRAKLNGTGVQPKFITTSPHGSTFSVAVNARHLFWTTNVQEYFWPDSLDTIGRANPDGSGVRRKLANLRHTGPDSIAVRGRYMYWVSEQRNAISRARLDGTGLRLWFIRNIGGSFRSPRGIAVEGNHIYWTNVSNTAPGTIGRANLDGSGVRRSFIKTGGRPWDVAVVR